MLDQTPTTPHATHPKPKMRPTNTTLPPPQNPTSPPKTTTTTSAVAHRRTLAADPATSSTKKKHPISSTLFRKDSDPSAHSIVKPFSKLYSSHQNAAVSSKKALNFISKSQIETSFEPISVSEIQDKPMSKLSHQNAAVSSKAPTFLSKSQIETSFHPKPVSASEIQDKPMSKLSHQSRKPTVEIEPNRQNAVVSSKPSIFLRKNPQIETIFEAKPISVSAIADKPMSQLGHQRRKTTLEVEKQKLRASITGVFDKSLTKIDKSHDFKVEFLSENKGNGESKKLKKKERVKGEAIVSLSKSQDGGLKVAHRGEGGEVKRPYFSLAVAGGRRRSFCNSQAELADFLSCNGVRIVSVDMPPLMQIHAVDCARKTCDSLEKFTSKTLAFTLKKEFDGVYGPAWHCVVGSSFGSFVTHSVGGFMYFSMDQKIYILLFKTTVQRAAG